MRTSSRIAFLGVAMLAAGCALLPKSGAPRPLSDARTVYLGDLGRTAHGVEARALLQRELERRGHFVVVSSAVEADAVLRGEIGLRQASSGRPEGARVFGTVQMIEPSTNRILWRHVYEDRAVEPASGATTPTELLQRVVVQLCDQLDRDLIAKATRH